MTMFKRLFFWPFLAIALIACSKAVGTQFYVSNSGDYTDNILTGEWTSVHE